MLTLKKVFTGSIWTDKNGTNHNSYNWELTTDNDNKIVIKPLKWFDTSILEMLSDMPVDLVMIKVKVDDKEYSNFYIYHQRGTLKVYCPVKIVFGNDFRTAKFVARCVKDLDELDNN